MAARMLRLLQTSKPAQLRLLQSSNVRYSSSTGPVPAPPTPTPRPPQKHAKVKKLKKQQQPSDLEPAGAVLPPPTTPSVPSSTILSKVLKPTPASPTLPALGVRRRDLLKADVAKPSDGKAIALTTSESFETPQLLQQLQALGLLNGAGGSAVNLMGEAIYIPSWSPAKSTEVGEVFLFESGTIVSWGLSTSGINEFLRQVVRGTPPVSPKEAGVAKEVGWVEKGRYNEPEMEELQYWVNPDGETKMLGDALHLVSPPAMESAGAGLLPSPDLLARLAFSAAMARMTKLGFYEEAFDSFAEGVAGIPKLLESGSESPVKKTDIIKRLGTLHHFRQKLNLEDENLLDEPEFLWEDEALHGYYTSVCQALEFEGRLNTLNQRVDYAFQLQSTLMELLNTKTSHRLEWIIIILIAFEISIVLLREGFALRDGSSHEGKPEPKGKQELPIAPVL